MAATPDYLQELEAWRHRDCELFDTVKKLTAEDRRSVGEIQNSGILGSADFADEPVDASRAADRDRWRKEWFERVRNRPSDCDLVFADPDDGLPECLARRRQLRASIFSRERWGRGRGATVSRPGADRVERRSPSDSLEHSRPTHRATGRRHLDPDVQTEPRVTRTTTSAAWPSGATYSRPRRHSSDEMLPVRTLRVWTGFRRASTFLPCRDPGRVRTAATPGSHPARAGFFRCTRRSV